LIVEFICDKGGTGVLCAVCAHHFLLLSQQKQATS
jgi:hypothetical protein